MTTTLPIPGDVIQHRNPYPGEETLLIFEIGPDPRTENRTLIRCVKPSSDDPTTGWTDRAQEWMSLERCLEWFEIIGHANLERGTGSMCRDEP
ncbi:MAG: hypothetical protein HC933_06375 [Pleurocapsa sp. SU_196_0]|nr:hypothetical protein [Pleurocapsa sp. SU_196_0]